MMQGKVLAEMAITILGSPAGLASALEVNVSTVSRWVRGAQELTGASKVAVMAIIKHPGEYQQHYIAPGKPGRKPKREEPAILDDWETKQKGD